MAGDYSAYEKEMEMAKQLFSELNIDIDVIDFNDVNVIASDNPNGKVFIKGEEVDCPDFVIFDQKDGYYLLRNFRDITHYSSFEKKDILSVEAGSYISVSQNGMLLAVSLYPYRKIVNVYNLQSFKQVLSIPVDNIITSISFSDESHYLLISGKHPLLVECNY